MKLFVCNIIKIDVLIFFVFFNTGSFAHEPLYGHGPDVIFKGGFEPHMMFHFKKYEFENELACGYGVTSKWTLAPELSMLTSGGKSKLDGYVVESNYRFLKIDKTGLSYKASFLTELSMPFENNGEKGLLCALTAGQEALKWYWFSHIGFEKNLTSNLWSEGNQITWGLTVGIRPHKPNYYKPDLVFLLESTGNFHQNYTDEEAKINVGSGNNADIAPTFVFSYRNAAIRGGVQFGVLNSGSASKTGINTKIAIEIHL